MSTTSVSTEPQGGLKDTFESILIALILAFVFRCFVVEAFVIPTGSMAPTLLGAHMRFKCEDCGYDFTVNYSAMGGAAGSDDANIPREASVTVRTRDGRDMVVPQRFNLTCPNCGFKVPEVVQNNPINDATVPPVHYGDRILVMKYAYLMSEPQRWDVVVFRSPHDQAINDYPRRRSSSKPEFQQNYIKRLVGLPGEHVMILDGDIYTRRSSESPWTIQKKSNAAQQAVWRIIVDNDYQPRNLAGTYRTPWISSVPEAVSTDDGGRRYSLTAGATPVSLTFDPTANPRKFALTDWLAFNTSHYQQQAFSNNPASYNGYMTNQAPADFNVSDLKVHLNYERMAGEGDLKLSLTKRSDTFIAVVGKSTLSLQRRTGENTAETLATTPLPADGKSFDIVFQNVDYRVSVTVNGKELIATTPEQYGPNVAGLIDEYKANQKPPQPSIQISATNVTARISHLSLWRDLYYLNGPSQFAMKALEYGSPDSPAILGPKEYFVCGDNSQLSLDARYWDKPVDLVDVENLYADPGRVPDRFMLGKAFFVYWPAGHRPAPSLPGIIPNFGEMRMIH